MSKKPDELIKKQQQALVKGLIADNIYNPKEIKQIISIICFIILAVLSGCTISAISNIIPLTNIVRIIITIINQAILFLIPNFIADITMIKINEKIKSFHEKELEELIGKSYEELFGIALEQKIESVIYQTKISILQTSQKEFETSYQPIGKSYEELREHLERLNRKKESLYKELEECIKLTNIYEPEKYRQEFHSNDIVRMLTLLVSCVLAILIAGNPIFPVITDAITTTAGRIARMEMLLSSSLFAGIYVKSNIDDLYQKYDVISKTFKDKTLPTHLQELYDSNCFNSKINRERIKKIKTLIQDLTNIEYTILICEKEMKQKQNEKSLETVRKRSKQISRGIPPRGEISNNKGKKLVLAKTPNKQKEYHL